VSQARYDVDVAFKHLRYLEGDRSLDFDREPGGNATPGIVWVPSPKRWREIVPDWAKGRRTEILTRLRSYAPDDEWRVFYADVDAVGDDDLPFPRR
jgi:hypothetical protein